MATPKKAGKGSVFDRLTDTSKYTGAHKHRFDEEGRGRGKEGRDSVVKGGGSVPSFVVSSLADRTSTGKAEKPKAKPSQKKAESPKKPTNSSPTPKGEIKSDGMCKYAPDYGCSVTSCYLKCLHCGEGYCTACLWGESGKMPSLTKCANCGKVPRSLKNGERPEWEG